MDQNGKPKRRILVKLRNEIMIKMVSESVEKRKRTKGTGYLFGKNKSDICSFSSFRHIRVLVQPTHPKKPYTNFLKRGGGPRKPYFFVSPDPL